MNARPRSILHVDMDAFFASVEVRDAPSLRERPVLVGGTGRRGVVAAASYEARRFGCRSAQPMAVARRLCPQAVVCPPRYEVYVRVSRQVFAIFETFTPLVEPLSIDEAFLDVSGTERLFGPPQQLARQLRERVRVECGLTCSVGIASVKFVAKIASSRAKPDGLTEVRPGLEREFLAPLAVSELWGVGPKTAARLRERGIATVGELRRLSEAELSSWLGSAGVHLYRLAHAIDPRPVVPERDPRQLSVENTYEHDVFDRDVLRGRLVEQATRLADRLVRSGWKGRTVVLKLRDGTFKTRTRQRSLARGVYDARTLAGHACALLDELYDDAIAEHGVRLTGIAVTALEVGGETGLEPGDAAERVRAVQPEQMQLAWTPSHAAEGVGHEGAERVQDVLSAVRSRFGARALRLAGAAGDDDPTPE